MIAYLVKTRSGNIDWNIRLSLRRGVSRIYCLPLANTKSPTRAAVWIFNITGPFTGAFGNISRSDSVRLSMNNLLQRFLSYQRWYRRQNKGFIMWIYNRKYTNPKKFENRSRQFNSYFIGAVHLWRIVTARCASVTSRQNRRNIGDWHFIRTLFRRYSTRRDAIVAIRSIVA